MISRPRRRTGGITIRQSIKYLFFKYLKLFSRYKAQLSSGTVRDGGRSIPIQKNKEDIAQLGFPCVEYDGAHPAALIQCMYPYRIDFRWYWSQDDLLGWCVLPPQGRLQGNDISTIPINTRTSW